MNATASVLRPLSLSELLDRAIRLYRRNFLKFVGIIAIVQIPLAVLQLLSGLLTISGTSEIMTDPASVSPGDSLFDILGVGYLAGAGVSLVLALLSLFLVQGVASAALTRMISDTYLGEDYGMLDAYKRIQDRWGTIAKVLILYIGLAIALSIWTIVPCVGWISGPGMLVSLSFMVFPLVAPVVVLERHGGRKSIRRAWELVRRRFWWVAGFVFLLFIFSFIVVGIPNVILSAALTFFFPEALVPGPGFQQASAIQTILQSISSLFFSLLFVPLQLTCSTLLYFDLRVRSEGLDLMAQAEEQSETGLSIADLVAQPTEAPSAGVVTWQEMGYFSLFSIVAMGLYFAILLPIALLLIPASSILSP